MATKPKFVLEVQEAAQIIQITCEDGADGITDQLQEWGYLPPYRGTSDPRRYWTLRIPMGDPEAMARGQEHAHHLQSLGYDFTPY